MKFYGICLADIKSIEAENSDGIIYKHDINYIPSLYIKSMTENEWDDKVNKIFNLMRKQYPSMVMGDIQTVAMFAKMFKEENLTDDRGFVQIK